MSEIKCPNKSQNKPKTDPTLPKMIVFAITLSGYIVG